MYFSYDHFSDAEDTAVLQFLVTDHDGRICRIDGNKPHPIFTVYIFDLLKSAHVVIIHNNTDLTGIIEGALLQKMLQ